MLVAAILAVAILTITTPARVHAATATEQRAHRRRALGLDDLANVAAVAGHRRLVAGRLGPVDQAREPVIELEPPCRRQA
jgi:hypothetical protein